MSIKSRFWVACLLSRLVEVSLKKQKQKKNSYYFQSLPLGGILKFQANKEINNVGHRCRHFIFFIPDSAFKVPDQTTRPNSKQNSSSSMSRTKKQ